MVTMWLFVLFVLCVAFVCETSAFLPSACPLPSGWKAGDKYQCCPTFSGDQCGSSKVQGPVRGECKDVSSLGATRNCAEALKFYPFSRICVCNEGYTGPACGQCATGYESKTETGPCVRSLPRKRMPWSQLTEDQRLDVVLAFTALTYEDHLFLWPPNAPASFVGKRMTTYDALVWMHITAIHGADTKLGDCTTTSSPSNVYPNADVNYAHGGPGFPTWHRAISRLMEWHLVRKLNDHTLGLPFWDWRSKDELDMMLTPGAFGSTGDPSAGYLVRDGIFHVRKTLYRNGSTNTKGMTRATGLYSRANSLPTTDDIKEMLKQTLYSEPPWDSRSTNGMSNVLEGFRPTAGSGRFSLHNLCHLYTGGFWAKDPNDLSELNCPEHSGTMSNVDISPNDPIFWLLHSGLDYFLTKWTDWNPKAPFIPAAGAPAGHNLNDCLVPIFPFVTSQDLWVGSDTSVLGYIYVYENEPGPKPPNTNASSTQIANVALQLLLITIVVLLG